MLWIPAILVAAVSNLDNLAAGVAFGIRGTRIGASANLIIAFVTMAATAVAMTSGRLVAELIPSSVAETLGSLIIIGIGLATIVSAAPAMRAAGRPLPWGEHVRDDAATVSIREALALGVALSMNNLASGAGAGAAGIPPLATTLLAGALSLLSVGAGSWLGGSTLRSAMGRRAPLVAGLVLLAVGGATLSGVR